MIQLVEEILHKNKNFDNIIKICKTEINAVFRKYYGGKFSNVTFNEDNYVLLENNKIAIRLLTEANFNNLLEFYDSDNKYSEFNFVRNVINLEKEGLKYLSNIIEAQINVKKCYIAKQDTNYYIPARNTFTTHRVEDYPLSTGNPNGLKGMSTAVKNSCVLYLIVQYYNDDFYLDIDDFDENYDTIRRQFEEDFNELELLLVSLHGNGKSSSLETSLKNFKIRYDNFMKYLDSVKNSHDKWKKAHDEWKQRNNK